MVGLSCAALILLSGFWSWVRQMSAAPTPEPSLPGGYYDDAFVLELKAPSNGSIYYTTDGSEPSTSSMLYTDGIRIQNRSQEPNVYTAVRNVVTDWKTFAPDQNPVPKGTVIRAIFVNSWGMQSEVLTQTYFVGVSAPQKGYTLSLVFEYDDLFGENGIHVTGKEYDDWYLAGEKTSPAPIPNFEKKQEVAAIVEMMDASGDVMNQRIGLRIQGGSNRNRNKKRFILESQTESNNRKVFPAEIFDGVSTHSVMTKDYPIDALVFELVTDRAISAQKSVPTQVFLNGEYWYDTYMLERYDKQFFREYYDVDEVLLVKNGQPDEELIDDVDPYGEFMYWAGNTDFSDEAEWEQLQKEMDVQSYIDYIITNYYLCNCDFSDNKNYIVWRSLNTEDSPYADTRWRWCIYDVDAMEFAGYHYDVENLAEVNIFSCELPFADVRVNETVLFRALSPNAEFRQRFVLSFMDMVNNNFSPDKVEKILEKYGETLNWQGGFFQKRPAYAVQHLAEEFQLTGTLETVTVTTANSAMGSVQVNTSVIDLSSGMWTGQYFSDYPITVTAIPADGCEFVGWKGDVNETVPSITVSMEKAIVLEPVFLRTK